RTAIRARRLRPTPSGSAAFRRRRSSSCNTSRCPTPPRGTFTANPITAFDSNQVTLRADQQITTRNRLFVRFSQHHSTQETPADFPAFGSTELKGPAYNIAGALTSTFGSSLVHELRLSPIYGEDRSHAIFQAQGSD